MARRRFQDPEPKSPGIGGMCCIGRTYSYVETIYKTTLLPLMAKSTRGRYEGVI